MSLSPGSRLGVFEISAPIGKGGMGEVYRARDTNLDRDVAIKVLPEAFAQDNKRLARFRHEAKILAALNHSNVATVHDFQHDADTDFLVMELVEGETLSERIDRNPLSIKNALDLFIQIARGLDAAHERGIVHRDLKPANIKITPDGNVKILDFGLAASTGVAFHAPASDEKTTVGAPPATKLTVEGQILGTPGYMSPEQARGTEVDKRTDIWAFGCCFYKALSGQNPFEGKTPADTIAAILEHDPDWDRLPRDIPQDLRSLIGRCLEKDPRRRLSSASDIALNLEHAAETIKRDSSTSGESLDRRAGGLPKAPLSFGLKAGIGFVAVALILFAAMYLGRSVEAPTDESTIATPPQGRSVQRLAVLPFENLSGEEDQKYFVEALTDELTGELAKISSITVISYTSTRAYKGTSKSAREIAEELNVDALVEGSVYRSGDQVQISAKLVDGKTEESFWGARYDSAMTNVMQLKSDIALAIAEQISATLTGDEHERIASAHPVNEDAYNAYVIGNYFLNEGTEKGLLDAIGHFKEATRLDPEYAHGWGGLVCAYAAFPIFGLSEPREYFPKARAAGLRALALDYDLAGDQSHMGLIAMAYDWEWEHAEDQFLRSIDLSPSGVVGYADYALYLVSLGRGEEAVRFATTALDLDPHPSAYFTQKVIALVYMESDPKRAWQAAKGILAEKADFYPAMDTVALAYKYLGNYEAAIATAEEWVDMVDRDAPSLVALARSLSDAGREEPAREVLSELIAIDGYFDSAGAAYAYVSLGDIDTAFDLLQKGFYERNWGMVELRTVPYWKIYDDNHYWIRFRSDARYWDLIERMNFPPFPAGHAGYAEDQAWRARDAAENPSGD